MQEQTARDQTEAAVTLDEIRRIIADLPASAARAEDARLDAFGALAPALSRMAAAQERDLPQLPYPRIAVFAASHGCAGTDGIKITKSRIATYLDHDAPVNALAAKADIELQLYELNPDAPTADYRAEPAMSPESAAHAVTYGMMAAQPGMHLLSLSACGAGADMAGQALVHALAGRKIDAALFDAQAIEGLRAHPIGDLDPLALLSVLGGYDIAAITGALIAAKLAKIPVLLEDMAGLAAAAVLHTTRPELVSHCLIADTGGKGALLSTVADYLGLPGVAAQGYALDAGGASAMTVPVLQSACAGLDSAISTHQ